MRDERGGQSRQHRDPLFDRVDSLREPVRRTDPATSATAAQKLRRSGKLGLQCAYVMGAVKLKPGLTSAEYAAGDMGQRHVYARRLPDLETLGYVRKGIERICRQTGSESVTWWPTEVT